MAKFVFVFLCAQALLIQNVFSQYLPTSNLLANSGCGCGSILNNAGLGIDNGAYGAYGAGYGIGYGNGYGNGLGINNGAYGVGYGAGYGAGYGSGFGGYGTGEVIVLGDLPVAGPTYIEGNVPAVGAVQFGGSVLAGGYVTVAGNTPSLCGNQIYGCGCNNYVY